MDVMLEKFARRLVSVRGDDDVRGVGRIGGVDVAGWELSVENDRLREENESLWEDLTRLQTDLEILASAEKKRNEVGVVEEERCILDRELEAAKGRIEKLERDLKNTKGFLGKVTVQKRRLEKQALTLSAEKDEALTENRNLVEKLDRVKRERLSIRSYLIQICRLNRDGRKTGKLATVRKEMENAVEDDSMKVLLKALEETSVDHANVDSDTPDQERRGGLSLLQSRQLIDGYFRRLESSFIAQYTNVNLRKLDADRRQLQSALDDVDQTVEEMGKENLRLESELRTCQLRTI